MSWETAVIKSSHVLTCKAFESLKKKGFRPEERKLLSEIVMDLARIDTPSQPAASAGKKPDVLEVWPTVKNDAAPHAQLQSLTVQEKPAARTAKSSKPKVKAARKSTAKSAPRKKKAGKTSSTKSSPATGKSTRQKTQKAA